MTRIKTKPRKSTYKAAAIVAPAVEALFRQRLNESAEKGELHRAPIPTAAHVEEMLDIAFWASLRREEGHSPKLSIAYLAPEHADFPLRFEHRLSLNSAILTKLGPGVERPGVHLGIWFDHEGLYIWGTVHKIPNYCFVLDVSEPGLLVVKYRQRSGVGKFTNSVVLIGDQIKMVDESNAKLPDCPKLLTSLLGFTSPNRSVNVLIELATSMRAHKQGGTLLVVPSDSFSWMNSIHHPMKYSISPAFSGLSALVRQDIDGQANSLWQSELNHEIDSIAGLTAIDGATIITDKHEVLAFGAKIGLTEGSPRIDRMVVTEPIVGGDGVIVNPANSGGMRHLSAAQFVHDQPDSLALVASQDGQFTIFTWSRSENIVQAHRIDSLLL